MKLRDDLSVLAQRLIVHAANKAPEIHSERPNEEWLADFE